MPVSPALVGVVVLALIFILASWRGINVGTLAFPGALLVGTYAGLDIDEQLAGFPVELFIVVVGITYLFGIAQANGTIDWLLTHALRLLRGRVAFLPLLVFLIAFAMSAIGAVGTATLAMTLPIAMASAYRFRINPFLMAMMTTCGMQAGYFSPNAIYSATVVQLLEDDGFALSRLGLFVNHAVLNVLIGAVVYILCGGMKLLRRGRVTDDVVAATPTGVEDRTPIAPVVHKASAEHARQGDNSGVPPHTAATSSVCDSGTPADEPETRAIQPVVGASPYRWATLAALILLFAGVLALNLDPGMLALALGCTLMLFFASKEDGDYVAKVSWPTVLMITGVLTYVGVLQATGALSAVSDTLTGAGNSTTGILFLAYLAGIVSAFASSIGTMGAVIPLMTPLLAADPSLSVLGSTTAVTASTYLVDPSPLSILGVLVLANARKEDQVPLFRKLVLWALGMVVLAPVAIWSLVVLPN